MRRALRRAAGFAVPALLAAFALAVPGAARAQHVAKGEHEEEAGQAAVDRDGKVRAPTREEAEALSRAIERRTRPDAPEPAVIQGPGGMQAVQLDERYFSTSVARIAGGKLEARCVESPAEAKAFVEHGNPPKPAAKPAAPAEER